MSKKLQLKNKEMIVNLTLKLKKICKSPVIKYSAINIVTKIIPVLLTFILAEIFEPSQYGLIALVLVFSAVFSSLISYGIPSMIARESHMCTKQEFGEIMSSSWIVSLIIFFLVLIGIILFDEPASWLGLKQEWLTIAVVLGLMLGRVDVYSKYLVAQQQVRAYAILEFSKTVIPALASIVLIFTFLDYAVIARVAGLLVGAVVAVTFGYCLIRKRVIYIYPSKKTMSRIFVYGTQILPQSIGNWIKFGADKIIIGSLMGLDVLGSYSFTFGICSIFLVFVSALNNAYLGRCMSMYKHADIEGIKNLRKRYIVISTVLGIICTVVVLLLPNIYWPDGYKVNEIVILLLMLSFWTQLIYLLYAKYYMFAMKLNELGYINLIATIVYVFSLIRVDSGEVEYVALCFFVYSLTMAAYVAFRTTYSERKD